MEDTTLIKDIYQNAKMGIIGIDEVIFKVKNKKLLKELTKEKKDYNDVCALCQKYLESHKEEVIEPSMMAKMGSEFFTQMKLFKDDSDKIILDMMLKGTNKSIDIVSNKKKEAQKSNIKVKKIINKMSDILNESFTKLQNIYKIYFSRN